MQSLFNSLTGSTGVVLNQAPESTTDSKRSLSKENDVKQPGVTSGNATASDKGTVSLVADTFKNLSLVKLLSFRPEVMGKSGKLAEVRKGCRARFWVRYTQTSSANTAAFTSASLSPIGATDFSSFTSVFDIWRVVGITVHACMNVSTTGATAQDTTWALAWDPANNAAYNNLADVLTAQHKIGPINPTNLTTAFVSGPKSGFHTMRVKLPTQKEFIVNDQVSNIVGGSWVASQSANSIIGFLKFGVSAQGTAAVSNVIAWVEFHVEFKSRT